MLELKRRSFLTGLGALIVAPSIVRVQSIMPVKSFDPYYRRYLWDYCIGTDSMILRCDVALHQLKIPREINGFIQNIPEHVAFKILGKENIMAIKPNIGVQKNVAAIVSFNELVAAGYSNARI